jgi:hypothetical protein
MYRRRGLGLVLLALTAVGCGGGKGTVSGQVRFRGQPLPSGRVTFVCEGGDRPVLTADVRDGTYTISGAPVGPVKIAVATYQVKTTPVPNMPRDVLPPGGGPAAPPGKYVAIPARYADPERSGLSSTVRRGDQSHDIDLREP